MSEASKHSSGSGSVVDPQSRSSQSASGDDTTTVFATPPDGQSSQDTTQLERPAVPPGSPTPPWQRGSAGPGQGAQDKSGPAPAQNGGQPASDGAPGAPAGPPQGLGVPPAQMAPPAPAPGLAALANAAAAAGPAGPAGAVGHHPPAPAPFRPTARPNRPTRDRAVRAPRKASLQIRRFDPWSVLKLSLVLSVAMFLMWLVAVGLLYSVLDGMGVWDKLNGAYSDLASVSDASGGGEPLISAGRVFGVSAIVGAVNIVLFTAFATVVAFVYNVAADLAGGLEVTLSERD